jgi:transglutaminase-like putative cysteine protease
VTGSSVVLSIRHVTGFLYDGLAVSSYNEARMTPPTTPRQHVLESSLHVHPHAVQSTYRDYFDTIVTSFDIQEPHGQLEVVAEATVEIQPRPTTTATLRLGELRRPDAADRWGEYLAVTPRTEMSPAVTEQLRTLVPPGDDVAGVADTVVGWVRERVEYVKGATLVSSTAQEVWDESKGVCQDLTHVSVALLRSLGIPARYVSGYLHPDSDAGVGESVLGESHAWVEFFNGDWVGIDPTNGGGIGLQHVMVAKGREYGDVPPLKGIYRGGTSSALGVVVEISRLR